MKLYTVTVVRESSHVFSCKIDDLQLANKYARFWCEQDGTQRVFYQVDSSVKWIWEKGEDKLCAKEDCCGISYSNGLCRSHYDRSRYVPKKKAA